MPVKRLVKAVTGMESTPMATICSKTLVRSADFSQEKVCRQRMTTRPMDSDKERSGPPRRRSRRLSNPDSTGLVSSMEIYSRNTFADAAKNLVGIGLSGLRHLV